MATGASAGFYFGGNLLEFAGTIVPARVKPWRAALLCLSLLAIPLFCIGLVVRDPPRGIQTGSERSEDVALEPFLRAHKRRILLFLGAAGGLPSRCRPLRRWRRWGSSAAMPPTLSRPVTRSA